MNLMFLFKILFFLLLTLPTQAARYKITKMATPNQVMANQIEIRGLIDTPEWSRWLAAISTIDRGLDTLIVIDSPGGTVPGGFFLIRHIEEFIEAQKLKQKRVAILIEGVCASMCVPIYFTFDWRYMTDQARIGLHGVSMGGLAQDFQQTDLYLKKMISKAQSRGELNFVDWLNRQKEAGVFASQQLTWIAGRQFIQDGAEMLSPNGIVVSRSEIFK